LLSKVPDLQKLSYLSEHNQRPLVDKIIYLSGLINANPKPGAPYSKRFDDACPGAFREIFYGRLDEALDALNFDSVCRLRRQINKFVEKRDALRDAVCNPDQEDFKVPEEVEVAQEVNDYIKYRGRRKLRSESSAERNAS
jgi:hypothetical protein